jgi:hypothetical protein
MSPISLEYYPISHGYYVDITEYHPMSPKSLQYHMDLTEYRQYHMDIIEYNSNINQYHPISLNFTNYHPISLEYCPISNGYQDDITEFQPI